MSATAPLFIGLDAGTSVIKAIAFDRDGRQVADAATPNHLVKVDDGGVEQDMNETWRGAASVLAALAARVPDLARRAAAIAVTAQGDGTWMIDARGEPVGRAWLWLDGRAGEIVSRLREDGTDAAIFRRTGTALSPSLQSVQLRTMRVLEPDRLARASKALHCKDWLYLKLAGEIATDPCEGVNSFGDTQARRYDDDVVARLGLTDCRRLLPELVDGTSHHGRLTADAARATGLAAGLPVVLAPVDYVATAIGGGVLDRTQPVGCTVLGSAGVHLMLFDDPRAVTAGPSCGYSVPFPRPNTWLRMISNMSCTLNIDWLVGNVGGVVEALGGARPEKQRLIELLDDGASRAAPGRALYHPFIFEAGERAPFVEPRARAQFTGLTSQVTFFDMMRAIYEGIAFSARDCYEAMPQRPHEIRLAGGAARSDTLRRVLAATTHGRVRRTRQGEAGAIGAACVAAVCLGVFPDLDAACAAWVDPQLDAHEAPDDSLLPIYDGLFAAYRKACRDAVPLWSMLHEMRRS